MAGADHPVYCHVSAVGQKTGPEISKVNGATL